MLVEQGCIAGRPSDVAPRPRERMSTDSRKADAPFGRHNRSAAAANIRHSPRATHRAIPVVVSEAQRKTGLVTPGSGLYCQLHLSGTATYTRFWPNQGGEPTIPLPRLKTTRQETHADRWP